MSRCAWVVLSAGLWVLGGCSSSSAGELGNDGGGATVNAPAEVSCQTSLECLDAPDDAAICDVRSRTCVQCVGAADCGSGEECAGAVCSKVLRCDNSLDCPLELVCDPVTSRCVQCALAADCGADAVCAGAVCRAQCASDRACTPMGLLCNREIGHCVECFADTECPTGGRCDAGACVAAEGPSESGCPEGEKRCDGGCVPLSPEVGCGIALCSPCPEIANGSSACSGVDCDVVCDPGFVKSGMTCLPVPAECSDGVQSAGEADVDCGGSQCGACENGRTCQLDQDCAATSCVDNRCQASQCANGAFDPGETDVDCGGPDCPRCPPGAVCEAASDCDSGRCPSSAGRCAEPTCTDLVANGNEVGRDCGGPDCPKCPDGDACRDAAGCLNGVCADSVCRPAHCGNGVLDEGEVDVDCGGFSNPLLILCPACPDGAMCTSMNDCRSRVCTPDRCQAPSCSDGVPNGSETATDCGGGACPGCGYNQGCRTTADCAVGQCVEGACRAPCQGDVSVCPPCAVPTFAPCCRGDGFCGCGIIGSCIL